VPKPPAELTLAVTNEVPCQEDEVLQTPVTPVSAEGLMSLQNLILRKDAHALDKTSKQSLERHVLKFAKAAQLSLTKGALQQNQIQHLMAINNEAKPRRSTRADILEKGSGQVFSYEHLQEKRLKRAEMDAAKEAKAEARRSQKCTTLSASTKGRGRKRKSTALEVEANSLDFGAGPSVPKDKVAKVSHVQAAEAVGVPFIAPVAKMY
jgi:hypothetical protein